MAKRGRPRKAGERGSGGRLKKPTLEQIMDADKAKRRENKLFVASQPHRRYLPEPFSERAASALGRFCMVYQLREELYQAGMHYSELTRRWRGAWGCPDPIHSDSLGGGLGPSEAAVETWWRHIEGIEKALRAKSMRHYAAARHLCVDDGDLPEDVVGLAIEALQIVADQTGRSVAGHPFERPPVDNVCLAA
jgi:hypothetical protein